MQNAATATPLPLAPGAAEALADHPEFGDLVRALAAAPLHPAAARARSVAPAVRAAIRRRALLRRLVLRPAVAAAAIAALALLLRPGAGGPAAGAPASPVLAGAPVPAPAAAAPFALPSADPAALLASQRADGSWAPARGGDALAPAATGLAVLVLARSGDPAVEPALRRAAAWLRAHQNPDGSFGAAAPGAEAYNLALPAAAMLRLYGDGGWPELFPPIDGAVAAVRDRLARAAAGSARAPDGEVWLASALARADALAWSDAHSGDLRRALRRLEGSGDARLAALAEASSFGAKREALVALCAPRI